MIEGTFRQKVERTCYIGALLLATGFLGAGCNTGGGGSNNSSDKTTYTATPTPTTTPAPRGLVPDAINSLLDHLDEGIQAAKDWDSEQRNP